MAEPHRDDRQLVARLREGDETTFTTLIDLHHGALRRLARTFVASDAAAEEVVQDTWVAVLDGLATFEERSSLKTWIFRILVNRAKTKGMHEARTVPISALGSDDEETAEVVVDPSRFTDRGMWSAPPERWDAETPAKLLLRRELVRELERAIEQLPERQRRVVVLRDALGWSSEEVCNVLELNETNQRVLLHRARSRLRALLEQYQANH
ncbi:MAG: RNA polymerase sigma factor [Kofleriaceae bacterium]